MEINEAASLLYEYLKTYQWLVSVGASEDNYGPMLIVYTSANPKKVASSIPDEWKGFRVYIRRMGSPRMILGTDNMNNTEKHRKPTMEPNQQKEQFSIAYVRAVASVAGFSVTEKEVDDDSIDLIIASRGKKGSIRSPRLELQLKCTSAEIPKDNHFSYELKRKNYDDLRGNDFVVPRILVVVIVPSDVSYWLYQTEEELSLRRCGYWLSLKEHPETQNTTSVTVNIPKENVFSVDQLNQLMWREVNQ